MTRRVAMAVLLAGAGLAGPGSAAQTRPRPAPETYHWVLPADRDGVDVATLHPNDCYRVQRAEGRVFFGDLTPALAELQRQAGDPRSHRVEPSHDPRAPEVSCPRAGCAGLGALEDAILREVHGLGADRLLRAVDHRPSPVDHWFGGAYTDVGSEDRSRFRNTAEQRMVYQHLSTARRGNCYEAKAPRTLSIHVRDRDSGRPRAGVYRGYLYVEHHHPSTVGESIAGGEE